MFCECSRKVDSLSVGLLPDDYQTANPRQIRGLGEWCFKRITFQHKSVRELLVLASPSLSKPELQSIVT